MSVEVVPVSGTVVAPEVRLAELAATITRQCEIALEAGRAMVEHAIACGEALLEAKTLVPPGQWSTWLEETVPHGVRRAMSRNYMRLAALKEFVDPELSITSNLHLVRGLEKRSSATPRVPEEVKDEAVRLHATGEFTVAAIARMLGTTSESVRGWINPKYAARRSARGNARRSELRAEREPAVEIEPPAADEVRRRVGRQAAQRPGVRDAFAAVVRRVLQAERAQDPEALVAVLSDGAAELLAWADRIQREINAEAAA